MAALETKQVRAEAGDSEDVRVKGNAPKAIDRPEFLLSKSDCGFVGLLNQGATCYLNSLLQSLYMTPEFKQALFDWKFDAKEHGKAEECIPRQLQSLFARLALSARSAVGTKELTHSFCWTQADAFRQHDVQELMRVLFNALEEKLGSDESKKSFMQSLYRGELSDAVTCCVCNNKSERQDYFLDVSLEIADCKSLEEALEKYVRAEELTGDNKYFCQKCSKKVDAKKQLLFRSLPKILTVQLKRFVFDFKIVQRAKVHHEVTFPDQLDMSRFLLGASSSNANTGSTNAASTATTPQPVANQTPNPQTAEKSEANKSANAYELFAVLIHSGTAMGGHYYAYIKSFKDEKWYEFNDAVVRPLPEFGMKAAFGGPKGGSSAYLLMYRQKDGQSKQASETPVPTDLKSIIEEEDNKHKSEREAYLKELRTLDLHVIFRSKEHKFRFDQGVTIKHATEQIRAKLELDKLFPADCVRLRRYVADIAWAEATFDEQKTLEESKFNRVNSLILETRQPEEKWPVFNPGEMPIRVRQVTAQNVDQIVEMSSYPTATDDLMCVQVDRASVISGLKDAIAPVLKISSARQRLIRLHEHRSEVLHNEMALLTEIGIGPGQVIYVEDIVDVKSPAPSALVQRFETTKCQIRIKFNLPDVEAKHPDYNQIVEVSKNDTLRQLKERISTVIDVPVDAFRVAYNDGARKLRDDSVTLRDLNLIDGSTLFVSPGRQLRRDEFNFKFHLYDTSADSRFTFLFELPISEEMPLSKLKPLLLDYLAKLKPDGKGGNGFGIQYMRLRSKNMQWSPSILMDEKTVKQNLCKPGVKPKINDGEEIAIQRISSPDKLTKDDKLFMVQQYMPETQTTGPLMDLIVRQMCTVGAFKEALITRLGVDIPSNRLGFAKGITTSRMTRAELLARDWYSALDENQTMKNAFQLHGGELILFKDNAVPLVFADSKSQPASSGTGSSAKKGAAKPKTKFGRVVKKGPKKEGETSVRAGRVVREEGVRIGVKPEQLEKERQDRLKKEQAEQAKKAASNSTQAQSSQSATQVANKTNTGSTTVSHQTLPAADKPATDSSKTIVAAPVSANLATTADPSVGSNSAAR